MCAGRFVSVLMNLLAMQLPDTLQFVRTRSDMDEREENNARKGNWTKDDYSVGDGDEGHRP